MNDMISFTSKGSFDKLEKFLKKMQSTDIFSALDAFGREGVNALAHATPLDTGETANSWTYEIVKDATSYSIIWGNTHVEAGRPIAVLIQLGHGTGSGGYVQGRDYINPALRPIFDRIADKAWKAVTTA